MHYPSRMPVSGTIGVVRRQALLRLLGPGGGCGARIAFSAEAGTSGSEGAVSDWTAASTRAVRAPDGGT